MQYQHLAGHSADTQLLLSSSHAFSFRSVQLLCHDQLFATPQTAACQASLFITPSLWYLVKVCSYITISPIEHFVEFYFLQNTFHKVRKKCFGHCMPQSLLEVIFSMCM